MVSVVQKPEAAQEEEAAETSGEALSRHRQQGSQ